MPSIGHRHRQSTLLPMNTLPLQFLLMTLAGWVNRSQQDVIEYLQEENRGLREHLGGGRLLFTDAQRRHHSAAGWPMDAPSSA